MVMEGHGDHMKLKPSVILTGTAKEGSSGPPIGLVDIGVSEGAYLFRVALPGVRKDRSKVKFEIKSDGRVHIEGVMTGPGLLKDSSAMYQMKVQQLCPPGSFTVSFKLPGPVDPRLSSPSFRPDGILEVVVMKSRAPPTVADSLPPP
ncbi:increased DNA methylation 3-like [Cucurbita maxima]|uniref:Increased DNA methylation 3-like n=1 Tax=Cucurbita maxima TaxID=3661 RepID=A0A6J1KJX1_CUCMA|nr:increased DNA methylation 3-like [Cucurbita maxima]XP_023002580.1 increased DNA methylation 3-like [Cucurbita maxima]XP_023002581.1 increased DNA methylation 3-like [Cucurbita maxima]XP_023002582.1 increased DNA methylation 3-like [Cucurbita maxima]